MLGDVDPAVIPVGNSNGAVFVCDEKTTSQLGQSWVNQWRLDSQFTGYVYAAKSSGYNVAGAVIRGISILKDKYGHAESVQLRSDWELIRWRREFTRDVKRMIERFNAGQESVSIALDKGVCGNYGGCSFSRLCESPNPDAWIPVEYIKNTWNPLHKE